MPRFKGSLFVPLVILLNITAAWGATPSATPLNFSRQTSILGKTFGISLTTSPNATQSGMNETFTATIFGKQKSLIQATVTPNSDFSKGQLQLFINGVQLATNQGAFFQGEWTKQYTIPAVNSNTTFATIPIGPVLIQVDGGYSLTGNVNADIKLGPSDGTDAATESVEAALNGAIQASSFVKGSVGAWVVRGGVEGQVDVADGDVDAKADLYLAKKPPTFTSSGALSFFSGMIGAFADYYSFWSGWKRFWSGTIYSWKGLCFNFDNGVQVNGKCAAK